MKYLLGLLLVCSFFSYGKSDSETGGGCVAKDHFERTIYQCNDGTITIIDQNIVTICRSNPDAVTGGSQRCYRVDLKTATQSDFKKE